MNIVDVAFVATIVAFSTLFFLFAADHIGPRPPSPPGAPS